MELIRTPEQGPLLAPIADQQETEQHAAQVREMRDPGSYAGHPRHQFDRGEMMIHHFALSVTGGKIRVSFESGNSIAYPISRP